MLRNDVENYFKGHAFEKVEIFLLVKGVLPYRKGDRLTQRILDKYCRKYENDKLIQGMVNIDYMYRLIKSGLIKA